MEKMKKLKEMIEDIGIAMVTTNDDGLLRSRPMAVLDIQNENETALWFFTSRSSPKISEIKEDSQVNLSFSNAGQQKYVSVSGKAKLSKNQEKIEELWRPQYKAWFPEGKDDPDLTLLKVEIEAAEYWNPPSSTVVHLIGIAKAMFSGEAYEGGENEKINLGLR